MIRITTLLWMALLAIAGGTVMNVSYKVRHVERHIAEIQRDMRQEQEAIRVLGAEWDTLNDPQRIDALSKRHLSLIATPVQRVVSLDDLPLRPSDEQIARLNAVPSAKDRTGAAKPDLQPKAIRPPMAVPVAAAVVPRPVDGVGLILARVERRE